MAREEGVSVRSGVSVKRGSLSGGGILSEGGETPILLECTTTDKKVQILSGSIPTRGNILLLDFLFSRSKTSDGIIANVVYL